MKKFTLLAGIALFAGAGLAQAEEVNGLVISNPAANEFQYYRISNMRVQRLSYLTGNIYDEYGYEEDNVIGDDSGMNPGLPEFLPDGTTPTPEIFSGDNIYMGLSRYAAKWWIGFSSIEEVVSPLTRFWYFTKGRTEGTVLIHNAVYDGTVMRNPLKVTDAGGAQRSNMGFDTRENQYFVLPVRELLEEQEFEMALTEEQLDHAFALSTSREVSTESNTALDASNYITRTMACAALDEVGDTILNEDGDTVYNYYGFAGADRTWSPIRDNGSNNNHEVNNGSLWFVEPASTEDAQAAIDAMKEIMIKGYQDDAEQGATDAYESVAGALAPYTNLPALVRDQTALQALIARASNPPAFDVSGVHDLATQEQFIANAEAEAQKMLVEAAGLIGNGAVVRFQQQLALRDYGTWEEAVNEANDEKIDTLALGNAYLAAGQLGWFSNGEPMVAGYPAIGPVIETTPGYDAKLTEWELIPVWNTNTFKLYNKASNSYIMNFDLDTLAKMTLEIWTAEEKADQILEDASLYTWATTQNADDAACFSLEACPAADDQAPLSDDEALLVEEISLNGVVDPVSESVTDNVRLVAYNAKTNEVTNIHRATSGSAYKFENYAPTARRWYAESNVFHVEVITEGGINEIEGADAPKAQGIYDLQGRRVSKAGKGLYIINGVKTIVR